VLWQLLYLRTILYIVHYEPVALVEPQLSLVWRWRWSGVECHWHPGAWPVVTPTILNEFAFYSETRPLLLCFSHTPGEDQPYRSSSSVVPPSLTPASASQAFRPPSAIQLTAQFLALSSASVLFHTHSSELTSPIVDNRASRVGCTLRF
jgi:hypothetical protein